MWELVTLIRRSTSYIRKTERKTSRKMKGEKEDKTKQKANKATVLLVALSTTAMDSSEWILG
jgi:hypothetical protein